MREEDVVEFVVSIDMEVGAVSLDYDEREELELAKQSAHEEKVKELARRINKTHIRAYLACDAEIKDE